MSESLNYNPCNGTQKTVLVTGFGPFSSNGVTTEVNASGKAIKLMNKEPLENGLNIRLITKQIPVEYNYVDRTLPKMWQEHNPHLSIHVGISDKAKGFTLEKQARKGVYCLPDNVMCVPCGQTSPHEGPQIIPTDLQVEQICDEFNSQKTEGCLKAEVSDEAGAFLCEYVYYTSLCQQLTYGHRSSLFVHVPVFKSEEEFEVLARGLERIVEICVGQIRARDGYDDSSNLLQVGQACYE